MRRRSAWGLFDGKKSLGGLLRGKSVSGRRENAVSGGLRERRKSAVERKKSLVVGSVAESGGEVIGATNGAGTAPGVEIPAVTSAAAVERNGSGIATTTATNPPLLPPPVSLNKPSKPPLGKKSQSEGNGIGKASKTGLLRGMSIRNGKSKANGKITKTKPGDEIKEGEEKDVLPVKAKRRRSWAFWRDDGGGTS